MANIGIVIAVSDYTHDAQNLPACRQDGAAIAEVLRLSGRFDDDDILQIIAQDTKSTQVKQRLAEFIKAHGNKSIDEVILYFSGHGEYYDNELYYLLTDYQQRRIKQTSLEIKDLDDMVRSGLIPLSQVGQYVVYEGAVRRRSASGGGDMGWLGRDR